MKIRFLIVGFIGALIELILFSTLLKTHLTISISNFLSFHISFVICFLLHYLYTYQKSYVITRIAFSSLIKYTGLMYVQLFLGTILLWMLIDKFGWRAEYAKFMQMCILTPISYIVQRYLIFRDKIL